MSKKRDLDNTMLISIIVPIYNMEQYLDRCIQSIIGQTYSNLEILLINDGSTDHSASICTNYVIQDSRIRLLNQSNMGLSAARNRGIHEAKGEYFMFVDSDDFIHPQMVEILFNTIIRYSSTIAVCDFQKFNENNMPDISLLKLGVLSHDIMQYTGKEALSLLFKMNKEYITFTVSWNKIYHRSIFEGLDYPEGKIHEDEFLAYQLLYRAETITYIKQELYYYFQREDSIMGQGFSEKTFYRTLAYKERAEFCIANQIYVRDAILSYLWEYQSYINQFREKYAMRKDEIEQYNRNFISECKLYRKYLSLEEYMKTRIKNEYPFIVKIIRVFAKGSL